jgi:hypothetical protein
LSELSTIGCTERKITELMCSTACTKQIAYRNPALKKWISQFNSKRAKASSSGDKQNRPQFESVAHNRLIYAFCIREQKHDQSQCMKWEPKFQTKNSKFIHANCMHYIYINYAGCSHTKLTEKLNYYTCLLGLCSIEQMFGEK